MKIISPTDLQLNDEIVVEVKRVSKATTGGRRMRFRCIVVVGDGKGKVGYGLGTAAEVSIAIQKAMDKAKRSMKKDKEAKDKEAKEKNNPVNFFI